MDGILEQWVRDARDVYVEILCEMTDFNRAQAESQFIKEGWNTNNLRKAASVARYRAQIMNENS